MSVVCFRHANVAYETGVRLTRCLRHIRMFGDHRPTENPDSTRPQNGGGPRISIAPVSCAAARIRSKSTGIAWLPSGAGSLAIR